MGLTKRVALFPHAIPTLRKTKSAKEPVVLVREASVKREKKRVSEIKK